MPFFAPNHVQLLNSCYPPTSALLTAGPAYAPNSHELSRLTYYASNHPGKLSRLAADIEKRVRVEAKKTKAGNLRARATLLISLTTLRALATECRQDIALITSSLIASVDVTLAATPHDLEVVARVASLFTAWTTYTDGKLIGVDNGLTRDYLSVLGQFANLSCCHSTDPETQNRTRLIGFAAITGALNSEALHNDSRQFKAQALIVMRPILLTIFETDLVILNDQSSATKNTSGSQYLDEFRTRPALERRAASIHLHIDGDKGPSFTDVSDSALRALFCLLDHAGGAQLGQIMQSSFENLDIISGWHKLEHCCWYAKKTAEWAQYQYRFVVPTWLVEKLLEHQDVAEVSPLQMALASMVSTVFCAPTPLINMSSADIMSSLLNLLLRRNSVSAEDPLIQPVTECIASLGCHVYYSDQIQDLAGEIINRINMVEVQGPLKDGTFPPGRGSAICHLITALKELIRESNEHGGPIISPRRASPVPRIDPHKPEDLVLPRRTRVSPEIWQDTLSLICDKDDRVRNEYADLLLFYIAEEMPKVGEVLDINGVRRINKLAEGSMLQVSNVNLFLNSSDVGSRFLSALHAYVYILAINATPNIVLPLDQADSNGQSINCQHDTDDSPRRSMSVSSGANNNLSQARKASLQRRLTQDPMSIPAPSSGWSDDYLNLQQILQAVQRQLPIRGLLAGVPMLIQLSQTLGTGLDSTRARKMIAEVWRTIGETWHCAELVEFANTLLLGGHADSGADQHTKDAVRVLHLLSSCVHVQEALGMNEKEVQLRLSVTWSPKSALYGFTDKQANAFEASIRGDNISPLLKLSPALMQIENLSLQNLTKGGRGLGVSDLREALEGRNSTSNPALVNAKAASLASAPYGDYRARSRSSIRSPSAGAVPRPRSRAKSLKPRKGRMASGDARDVLTQLGMGKAEGEVPVPLLKAPFQPASPPRHDLQV